MSGNQDQIDYWNGPAGQRWAEAQQNMDRNMASIHAALVRFAAVKPGERVLDIGCGCGTTSFAFADAAGATGHVTGVDISAPMLGVARARAGSRPVDFVEADASVYPFKQAFDAVTSRFGVMFFADPPAAFRNLARALKPGGRLAFVCWQGRERNAWMLGPAAAAAQHVAFPPPPPPDAPGPFAFADPARVRGILEDGGFAAIAVEAVDEPLRVAGGELDAAVAMCMEVGPVGAALREAQADPEQRRRVLAAVRSCLESFRTPRGLEAPAGAWIVTARRA